MSKASDFNPRELSFIILNEYIDSRTDLKRIIDRRLKEHHMSGKDRRFVTEIVKGTLRYLLKIDFLISIFSRIRNEKLDLEVLNILREAVYQFMYMDRVPAYSIVNESVNISKKYNGISSSGYINAVLRKIGSISNPAQYIDNKILETLSNPEERMSIGYSYPGWLVNYWIEMYGIKKTEKLLDALNRPSPNYIRINILKNSKKDFTDLLLKEGFQTGKDFNSLEEGYRCKVFENTMIIGSLQNIKNFPGYDSGLFSIQDYSSQFIIKNIIKPKKGEKILDLCGAPGGKATHISELTGDICDVLSIDINDKRIKLFRENLRRLDIKGVRVLKRDVTSSGFLNGGHRNYFDKILIDCPCSALGTISRNPDVKYNKSIDDLKRLSLKSLQILRSCRDYLKKGKGCIYFYTCTLSRIENQEVIKKFIKENNNDFAVRFLRLPVFFIDYLKNRNIDLEAKIDLLEIMPFFFESEGGFIAEIQQR